MVLLAENLFFCLLPMLIEGILKLGASIIPDEELPITILQLFIKPK